MMDKLNKINVNIGSVKNDLAKHARKPVKEEQEQKPSETPLVVQNQLDADKVLDAMKKHGIHNLNHVMASGKVGCKSITESINYFTSIVTPEMHSKLTEKVKATCKKEFPSLEISSDLIAEVVDNLLFDALLA